VWGFSLQNVWKGVIKMKVYNAHVDGSYRNALVGWGFIITDEEGNVISSKNGIVSDETASKLRNVAGEMSAAMRTVAWAKKHHCKVVIHYDYNGICYWPMGNWTARKPSTQVYRDFMQTNREWVQGYKKVKSHSGNPLNDVADELARAATA
jgi:ribonuclease HI